MSTTRQPLTNTEQVYRTVFLDLCALYVDRKQNEAQKLAWEFYQDPHIPLILRITCCSVLGEAKDGEYLRFAQEAVEHASRGAELNPENETAQLMLEAAQEVLKNAELDAQDALVYLSEQLNECGKTEAEADRLAAEIAARDDAAADNTQESYSQHQILTTASVPLDNDASSVNSTRRANGTFDHLSSPQESQGPQGDQEGDQEGDHND